MSNYLKLAAETTDQYLTALAEGQDNFLKSISAFTSWVPAGPTTPAFSGLPTMQEVTEANFTFAQKLLKQQQDFTAKLVAATEAAPAYAKNSPAKGRSAASAA